MDSNLILFFQHRFGSLILDRTFFFFRLWFKSFFFHPSSSRLFKFGRFLPHSTNFLFVTKLVMKGIGYKFVRPKGKFRNFLRVALGYSVRLYLPIPVSIFIKHSRTKLMSISFSYFDLSRFIKLISIMRLPDPYKAKGVRFADVDYSQLKPGKQR